MLADLITWSLRNRLVVMTGALVLCMVGGLAMLSLNIDAFPDTTPVQVQVNTLAPALVPEEVERSVTFPIELALGGMKGLESMRSMSLFGISQVVLTFRDGTDIYFARQVVNERLNGLELPPGVPRPEMGPVSTGLGEVFQYVLKPNGMSLTDVRTLQDWTIKPGLRSVSGIAELNVWGGFKKQYQIRLDPNRLIRFGLTFDEVVRAVPTNNLNVGGGNLVRQGDALLVHGVGRTVNEQEIGNIVIKAVDGVPVRIRDVADVVVGEELRRGLVTADGQGEVVLGIGYMMLGENSYEVTGNLVERYENVRKTIPEGVKPEKVYDRTTLVGQVIDTVRVNLTEGAYFVVVILFLLLGNLRAGLIAAAAIPLSLFVGFCGMWSWSIAGSLLSLGAIDFGIVVDSSVVVIESIMRKLGHNQSLRGQERLKAIRDAAVEVRNPAVFGQLIIMIVYLPILSLEGVEGKMFRPMAMTVIFILIGSLIVSLTFTPVLASYVLPKRVEEKDSFLVRLMSWLYGPALRIVMRLRWPAIAGAVACLAWAVTAATKLGTEFVPRLSEGDIVIGIIRAPGTSLERSASLNTSMERTLLTEFPNEIARVWSRVGTPEVATEVGSMESTDMFIALKPRDNWKRAKRQSELAEQILASVNDIEGQIIWITQPIEQRLNEMVSGVRADVAIKLYGKDLEELVNKASELQRILKEVPGSADVATEQVMGQPILKIRIDQEAIARYGVAAQSVLDVVESVGGKALGEVVEGQLRFPLVVRLPERLRESPASLGTILIPGVGGEQIPLERVAKIELIKGPKLISREWGERRVTVQCNVRGRDVGSFVGEAQSRIAEKLDLPEDRFRIDWGGQFENMQRAQKRLVIVVPIALFLILVLLYMSYRNLLDTVILFLSVPFATIGGILALVIREMPLSIPAAVGFITLSGVSVLSSMVFVSALREKLAEGAASVRSAIMDTSLVTMRTIVMTALVASVGFIPMAINDAPGAEVQRPLASVVIGGVLTATAFSLFVLPAIYSVCLRKSAAKPKTAPAVA